MSIMGTSFLLVLRGERRVRSVGCRGGSMDGVRGSEPGRVQALVSY